MNQALPVKRGQAQEVAVVEQMRRADIDTAISTAHAFPRDPVKAAHKMHQIVLGSVESAGRCYYTLPGRKTKDGTVGKPIQGPSIRLMEIVAAEWGNLHVGTRLLEEGDRYIIVQGAARDLESNHTVETIVTRRITYRSGERYGDDLINVTIMAALSIAYRNVVKMVVPQTAWGPILDQAIAMGKSPAASTKTKSGQEVDAELKKRVEGMTRAFEAYGITPSMILKKVGRKDMAEITFEDLGTLRGIYTALKEDFSTAEEEFGNGEEAKNRAPLQTDSAAASPQAVGNADSQEPRGTETETREPGQEG